MDLVENSPCLPRNAAGPLPVAGPTPAESDLLFDEHSRSIGEATHRLRQRPDVFCWRWTLGRRRFGTTARCDVSLVRPAYRRALSVGCTATAVGSPLANAARRRASLAGPAEHRSRFWKDRVVPASNSRGRTAVGCRHCSAAVCGDVGAARRTAAAGLSGLCRHLGFCADLPDLPAGSGRRRYWRVD